MSTLKLGLHRLPAAEVVLIQTLLRLYGGAQSRARWTLADAPPYDALLVDATAPESTAAEWIGKAASVLRITRIGQAGKPNTIERPIRPDKLLRWLEERQPAMSSPGVPSAKEAAAADSLSEVRYRLLRWPPSSVLRNDARRVRLASLLSKRAFNTSELATMSQQSVDDCHAFLRMLRGTGLVEAQAELPSAGPIDLPADTSRAAVAPSRKPSRGFASGLIGGLRRRLGL